MPSFTTNTTWVMTSTECSLLFVLSSKPLPRATRNATSDTLGLSALGFLLFATRTLTASPSPLNVAHSRVVKLFRTQRCAACVPTVRGANTNAPRSIFW